MVANLKSGRRVPEDGLPDADLDGWKMEEGKELKEEWKCKERRRLALQYLYSREPSSPVGRRTRVFLRVQLWCKSMLEREVVHLKSASKWLTWGKPEWKVDGKDFEEGVETERENSSAFAVLMKLRRKSALGREPGRLLKSACMARRWPE